MYPAGVSNSIETYGPPCWTLRGGFEVFGSWEARPFQRPFRKSDRQRERETEETVRRRKKEAAGAHQRPPPPLPLVAREPAKRQVGGR